MQPVMQREREPEPVAEQFVELPSHSRLPRLDLGVDWGSPWNEFRSSVQNYFDGSKAPSPAEPPNWPTPPSPPPAPALAPLPEKLNIAPGAILALFKALKDAKLVPVPVPVPLSTCRC